MEKYFEENVAIYRLGYTWERATEKTEWNSFSKPLCQDDLDAYDDSVIGELNPEVESMELCF